MFLFKRRKQFALLTVLLLLVSVLSPAASAAELPRLNWAYLQAYTTSAELFFRTPASLLDTVDSYEFHAADTDWMTVGGSAGGSIILTAGGWVWLRYKSGNAYSDEFRTYVAFGETHTVYDPLSGASMLYHDSSLFPADAALSADRITSGAVYDVVRRAVLASQSFLLYDFYFLYGGGGTFSPGAGALLRIPLGTELERGFCEVYYVDEVYHRQLSLEVSYDYRNVVFRSNGAGLYYVVNTWDGVSPPPAAYAPPRVGEAVSFDGVSYLLGDVTLDGQIRADDARLALRAAVRLETLVGAARDAADADWDGILAAADARLILRAAVGLSD